MLLSFLVLSLSLRLSLRIYSLSRLVFPPCCLVISFSSGLIILFTYCRINLTYEKTRKSSHLLSVLLLTPLLCSQASSIGWSITLKELPRLFNSPLLLLGILVVLASILAINIPIFLPNKSLTASY